MTISAGYELIEFVYAYAHEPAADLYLVTQGDPWDSQWDMLCVLRGAVISFPFGTFLLARGTDTSQAKS
jgi:putative membrane protein